MPVLAQKKIDREVKIMKKRFMALTAAVLSLSMIAGTAAGCSKNSGSDAVSYMSVDINPSVSFTLDKHGKVLSVITDNEDGQVVVYGEEFVGLSAEEALDKLAELSVKLGYLNEANVGVSVTVAGKADDEEIIAAAKRSFEANAGDLDINVSDGATFELQRELKAAKAVYGADANVQGLDLVKFRLITEAQMVDNTLTVSAAAELDASELIAIIEQGAKKIEPYATAAYNTAVAAAQRVYGDLKGQLVDTIWTIPYTNDLVNIVTGNRKYDVNYGVIYNLYTSSSRVLGAGLDAAEVAAQLAEETAVAESVLDAIELTLPEADRQAFADGADGNGDGKVTVAELDDYFNIYFKNMTEEQRLAAEQLLNDVMDEVQTVATEIDASIADEYKAALNKLGEDIVNLIPDSIVSTVNEYVTEFKGIAEDIAEAAEGKEPMAAAYAAKQAIDNRAEMIMQTMREDLTEEDLADVESRIEKLNATLKEAEDKLNEAIEQAKAQAEKYLADLKAEREA